mmetsp:Transcript_7080/g.16192  ORF Transcript_7080/g.16192 Transcript_7080/m.16192 type:complete len:250 (-) Transcript_7080:200-949(-)
MPSRYLYHIHSSPASQLSESSSGCDGRSADSIISRGIWITAAGSAYAGRLKQKNSSKGLKMSVSKSKMSWSLFEGRTKDFFPAGHLSNNSCAWRHGITWSSFPWIIATGAVTCTISSRLSNRCDSTDARLPTRSFAHCFTDKNGLCNTRAPTGAPVRQLLAAARATGPVPMDLPIKMRREGSTRSWRVKNCIAASVAALILDSDGLPGHAPYPGNSTASKLHCQRSAYSCNSWTIRPRSTALPWQCTIK